METKALMARIPGGEAAIRARMAAAPGLSTPDRHRLAGLLDAECHLFVSPNNRDGWRCGCGVSLRDDDRRILVDLQTGLGLGRLTPVPARNGSRPQLLWKIESKLECSVLVDLLDEHPLRGRKVKEYAIWREAVSAWAARRYGLAPGSRSRLGEGSFGLGQRDARFVTKLRRDDRRATRHGSQGRTGVPDTGAGCRSWKPSATDSV
jgi:hypothetical protein